MHGYINAKNDVAYNRIPQFRPRTIHYMHFTLDTEVNNV
jgi:hypothetical protein